VNGVALGRRTSPVNVFPPSCNVPSSRPGQSFNVTTRRGGLRVPAQVECFLRNISRALTIDHISTGTLRARVHRRWLKSRASAPRRKTSQPGAPM
jgi:hypothetical protein